MQRENEVGAVSELLAFINHVNSLITSGTLPETNGQSLIDAANAIIDQLVGP